MKIRWRLLALLALLLVLPFLAGTRAQTRNMERVFIERVKVEEATHEVVVEWRRHYGADTLFASTFRVKESPNKRCVVWILADPGAPLPVVEGYECAYPPVADRQ